VVRGEAAAAGQAHRPRYPRRRSLSAGPWQSKSLGRHDQAAVTADAGPGALIQLDGSRAAANGTHIVRHDPARVLVDLASKQGIVDLFATAVEERSALRARMREVIHSDPDEFGRLLLRESELIDTAQRLSPVVRLLALPYAERPGYREE
jgi:hypothetical protein